MYIHEGARPGGEPHVMNVGRGKVQKYKSSLLHQAFIEHECDWMAGTITVASEDAAAAEATVGGLMDGTGAAPRTGGWNLGAYLQVRKSLFLTAFGVAVLPASPIFGVGLMIASFLIMPIEIGLDAEEKRTHDARKAIGLGTDPALALMRFAGVLTGIVAILYIVATFFMAWFGVDLMEALR